jgi:hypothetical protein
MFAQSLRNVYAWFTQCLRRVYAMFTHGLRNVCAEFTQRIRKIYEYTGVGWSSDVLAEIRS